MSILKCYIGQLDHKFGERELTYTFKFQTNKDPDQYVTRVAKIFWGGCYKFPGMDDVFLTFDDEVAISNGGWQLISEATFNELPIINTLEDS
jgi:hypothetical protein